MARGGLRAGGLSLSIHPLLFVPYLMLLSLHFEAILLSAAAAKN